MIGVIKAASSAILVAISYWTYFFGAELFSTLLLYQKGNGIYHVLNTTLPDSIHTNYKKTVPLIMHRMWRDDHILDDNNSELPANWTKAFTHCNEQYRKRNWTTILWTDESIRVFMNEHYPYFIPVYDSYPYNIQRIDAARYFILYHYGGGYMDLDVGCQKRRSLNDLISSMTQLKKEALVPLTEPIGFSNDVLFATKSSPFFKALIDALPSKNTWYGSPYLTVLYSTGPMFLSLQFMRMSPEKQNEVLVLSPELYTRKRTRYFRHLRGSTWHSSDARAVQWMIKNCSAIAVALFIAAIYWKVLRVPRKNESKIV